VLALRTLNFTEAEIRDMLSGRRALSARDVNLVMTGTYNPDNLPNFKRDSAIQNTIKNINRELEKNFTINDFVNTNKLKEIRKKYENLPLGLSEEEREEFLKSTPERKLDIKDKKIEDILKLRESQNQSSLPEPVTPAAPFLPDPQIANMFAANIDPTTGLTQTESALLSPDEQIIAKRLRT